MHGQAEPRIEGAELGQVEAQTKVAGARAVGGGTYDGPPTLDLRQQENGVVYGVGGGAYASLAELGKAEVWMGGCGRMAKEDLQDLVDRPTQSMAMVLEKGYDMWASLDSDVEKGQFYVYFGLYKNTRTFTWTQSIKYVKNSMVQTTLEL